MTHYHEVYFNKHTDDGPRVGATRRRKAQIERHWPGAAIVRCDRPDSRCPWTMDGVPGEATGDPYGALKPRTDIPEGERKARVTE